MLREVEANFAPEFSTLMVRDAFQRRLRGGIGEQRTGNGGSATATA